MRARRVLFGCLAAIVLALGVVLLWIGPVVNTLWRKGFFERAPERRYEAKTSDQNLKALYTALSLYADSEGRLPESSGWMDAIQNRIRASDMPAEEARKKLIRPDLLPPKPNVYGYAMSDAASGKYPGDLPPRTVLLFESQATGKNAHGDPARGALRSRPARGITVRGQVIDVPPAPR